MNVIGMKGTPTQRYNSWLSMIESKKAYKVFSKSPVEDEQSIAEVDKRVYNYHLEKYVA